MEDKKIKIWSNRSFGIVFSIVFLIVALYPLLNSDSVRIWSIILSSFFFIFGLLNSSILSPLNRIWFKFGIILGRIVSPIVMGLVFFLVVTPTSLILRLIKKFKEKTNCPVIVNTSFNVRGEPIVNTPKDAFNCFMGTELDKLVIGNCYLEKNIQNLALKKNYSTKFEID